MYDGGSGAVSSFNNARASMMQRFQEFKSKVGLGDEGVQKSQGTNSADGSQAASGDNTAILGNRQQINAKYANDIRNAKWEQVDAQIMQMPDMMQDVHAKPKSGGEQVIQLKTASGPEFTTGATPQVAARPAMQQAGGPEFTTGATPQVKVNPEEE